MSCLRSLLLLGLLLTCVAVLGYAKNDEAVAATQDQPTATQPTAQNEAEKQTVETGRKTHVRLGTISVGASYTHFSGPLYGYPWYPYSYWYSPLFWNYYGPFYYPGYFGPGNGRGVVRLSASPTSARVFIDNAYAGTVAELKSFWLDPGAYDLEVTAEGRTPYRQRIYVLSGKTLRITAALEAEMEEMRP